MTLLSSVPGPLFEVAAPGMVRYKRIAARDALPSCRSPTWLAVSVPIGGDDASHLARCAIRYSRAGIHDGSAYLARAAQ